MTELDFVSLGKNIRKHRVLAGLTQSQLAEKIGCSESHIGQIENARGIPSMTTVASIANTLDVGIDQLIKGDLVNRTGYFVQELVHLTDEFSGKDKLLAIELVKALMQVLHDFKD